MSHSIHAPHDARGKRLVRRRVLALLMFSSIIVAPTAVQADVNESSPTNPDAAFSGLLSLGDYNTCYVLQSGAVKCWGYNGAGNIGDGTTDDTPVPKDVVGLSGVKSISSNQAVCVVMTSTNGVKCWGSSPENGNASDLLSPTDVQDLTSGVSMVSVGGTSSCAVLQSGALKCWGLNNWGQLGGGSTDPSSTTPVEVTGLTSGVTSASVGGDHACAVVSGAVKCWGKGSSGQIGDGNPNNSGSGIPPTQVTGLTSGVEAISAGDEFNCALLNTGAVMCWGKNSDGQLGDGQGGQGGPGEYALDPVQVTGLTSGVVAISAGLSHACALLSTGEVKCWGSNDGALGNGSDDDSLVPVTVSGLGAPVKAVSAGSNLTCVLIGTADLRCFGVNYYGEIGDGTTQGSNIPVQVVGLGSAAPPTFDAPGWLTEEPLPDALPDTGGSANALNVIVGLGCLAVGSTLVAASRRRRYS
jgi:LPXTG-motif cell wall-anchored protein